MPFHLHHNIFPVFIQTPPYNRNFKRSIPLVNKTASSDFLLLNIQTPITSNDSYLLICYIIFTAPAHYLITAIPLIYPYIIFLSDTQWYSVEQSSIQLICIHGNLFLSQKNVIRSNALAHLFPSPCGEFISLTYAWVSSEIHLKVSVPLRGIHFINEK